MIGIGVVVFVPLINDADEIIPADQLFTPLLSIDNDCNDDVNTDDTSDDDDDDDDDDAALRSIGPGYISAINFIVLVHVVRRTLFSLSLSLSLSLTHTHTHTHTLSNTHSHPHSHANSRPLNISIIFCIGRFSEPI